jgi:AcrR family transcriptional regulator
VAPETLVERRRRLLRDEIRTIAVELFVARGFDTVTVDDIAEASGTSQRTFFRYFASKDDIVLDLARRLDDRLLAAVAARPGRRPGRRRGSLPQHSHVQPDERARVLALAHPRPNARAPGQGAGRAPRRQRPAGHPPRPPLATAQPRSPPARRRTAMAVAGAEFKPGPQRRARRPQRTDRRPPTLERPSQLDV